MQISNSLSSAEVEDLVIPQQFTYQFFEANRYTISEKGNYQVICNNGFIKLYTKQCRVYWHTQNEFGHETQDWKFHVSVKHNDLKRAWNLIAALFIKMNCRAGMKVIYLREAQNPQKGREITIYIVKYDKIFEKSQFAGEFGLDISIEHSEDYWLTMCRKIEDYLESYGIEPNGLAEGDYRLGKYISLRNEAFVQNDKGDNIYPPNSAGWNPLNHNLPINLKLFSTLCPKKAKAIDSSDSNRKQLAIGIFVVAFAIVGVLAYAKLRQKKLK